MSTGVVRDFQQKLYAGRMNMGRRIAICLVERGWQQVELTKKVPDLAPATLSALISRDSKWSEYAFDIATALNVNLRWLIKGEGPKDAGQPPEHPAQSLGPIQRRALEYAALLPEPYLSEWLAWAEERAKLIKVGMKMAEAEAKASGLTQGRAALLEQIQRQGGQTQNQESDE